MSNQNVPELRLDGFEGKWDVVQLGGFSSKVNEKNLTLTIAETFTNSAEHGVVSQIEFFKHQVSNDENLGGYYVVGPNDYIYNPRISTRAPVGPVNRNKLGRPGVVSPLYTVFRVLSVDHQYLDAFFMSSRWHSFMKQNGDSGARGDRLSINQEIFFQLPVAKPSYKEQRAIGAVFTKLDAAINQHTNKHRVLQRTKTSLLQRMFPQDDAIVPELRLDGFEGEWTHREVGDFVDVLAHNSLSRDQLTTSNTGIANVHYGDILIKFGAVLSVKAEVLPFVRDVENLKNVRGQTLIDGDIVFADAAEDASVGKCTEIRETFGCRVVAGLHTIPVRPREVFGDGFLGYAFNSDSFRNQLLPKMQGTKVSSISATVLKESRLALPPTVEEQQAIGAVFTKLDTLISAEAQLIEKLKQTKTALLQKMFV